MHFISDFRTIKRFVILNRDQSDNWAQGTSWHQIVVFQPNLREHTMNYVTKGSRILLTGKITYGEFMDKEDNKRTTTSIIADDITFFQ